MSIRQVSLRRILVWLALLLPWLPPPLLQAIHIAYTQHRQFDNEKL